MAQRLLYDYPAHESLDNRSSCSRWSGFPRSPSWCSFFAAMASDRDLVLRLVDPGPPKALPGVLSGIAIDGSVALIHLSSSREPRQLCRRQASLAALSVVFVPHGGILERSWHCHLERICVASRESEEEEYIIIHAIPVKDQLEAVPIGLTETFCSTRGIPSCSGLGWETPQ
jgi:hypothetical protein